MSEIPDDIWEKACAFRIAVNWSSNESVAHIAKVLFSERQRNDDILDEVRRVMGDVLRYNSAFPHLPGEISETLRRLLSKLEGR